MPRKREYDSIQAARIRQRILRQANLYPKKGGGLTTRLPNRGDRTTLMRYAEDRFGIPIERLISEGSLDVVAEKLDIDRKTVLNWRKRFGQAA